MGKMGGIYDRKNLFYFKMLIENNVGKINNHLGEWIFWNICYNLGYISCIANYVYRHKYLKQNDTTLRD